MGDALGVFVGSRSAFNVYHDMKNFGWMLHDDFDLHLITNGNRDLEDIITDFYTIYSYDYMENGIGEARALNSYLKEEDPLGVMNVVEPPIHATSIATLTHLHKTPFIYRYSSDLFDLYRVSHSWRKYAHFGLNNILGRVPLFLSDYAIALGPTGKKRLVDRGAHASKVGILPPPIDSERFQKEKREPEWNFPNDRSIILFAGRRTPIKGIHEMESAIPLILDQREDIQFVFVGSHGRSPKIPDKYRDHVTLVGRVPLGEMPKYFNAADLLVLPSYNEGLPRVITESLASGTPVVARDIADVAYATENTFSEFEEFVQMVINFESLPVDDVTPFTRETLRPQYIEFFKQI